MVSYLQSKPSLFVTCFGPELSWEDHFPKLINSYQQLHCSAQWREYVFLKHAVLLLLCFRTFWVILSVFRSCRVCHFLVNARQTRGDDTLPQRIPISLTIQLMGAINIPATFCQITENRGSNLIASAFNLQVNWNLHMRMFFLSHLKNW